MKQPEFYGSFYVRFREELDRNDLVKSERVELYNPKSKTYADFQRELPITEQDKINSLVKSKSTNPVLRDFLVNKQNYTTTLGYTEASLIILLTYLPKLSGYSKQWYGNSDMVKIEQAVKLVDPETGKSEYIVIDHIENLLITYSWNVCSLATLDKQNNVSIPVTVESVNLSKESYHNMYDFIRNTLTYIGKYIK